jgi:hypothetical protein
LIEIGTSRGSETGKIQHAHELAETIDVYNFRHQQSTDKKCPEGYGNNPQGVLVSGVSAVFRTTDWVYVVKPHYIIAKHGSD